LRSTGETRFARRRMAKGKGLRQSKRQRWRCPEKITQLIPDGEQNKVVARGKMTKKSLTKRKPRREKRIRV